MDGIFFDASFEEMHQIVIEIESFQFREDPFFSEFYHEFKNSVDILVLV